MKTIVILDDDPELTETVAEELTDRHHLVLAFSDPIRALEALRGIHADLLITDLSMPWIDGSDVFTVARQHQPGLRVLLMSGYARGAEIAARENIRFLQKPVDLDGLLSAVKEELCTT